MPWKPRGGYNVEVHVDCFRSVFLEAELCQVPKEKDVCISANDEWMCFETGKYIALFFTILSHAIYKSSIPKWSSKQPFTAWQWHFTAFRWSCENLRNVSSPLEITLNRRLGFSFQSRLCHALNCLRATLQLQTVFGATRIRWKAGRLMTFVKEYWLETKSYWNSTAGKS